MTEERSMEMIVLNREEQGKLEEILKRMVDSANRDLARLETLKQHVAELNAAREEIAKGKLAGPELGTVEAVVRRFPAGQVESILKKMWGTT